MSQCRLKKLHTTNVTAFSEFALQPDGDENTLYHDYFEREVKKLFTNREQRSIISSLLSHTFKTNILPVISDSGGKQPDYSLLMDAEVLEHWSVRLLVEMKNRKGRSTGFKNEDYVEAVDYGQRLLHFNPIRLHVFVLLCDCFRLQVLLISRKVGGGYNYTFFVPVSVGSEEGRDWLFTFLTASNVDLGFPEPISVNRHLFYPIQVLSDTENSIVKAVVDSNGGFVVCKEVHNYHLRITVLTLLRFCSLEILIRLFMFTG